MVCVDEEDAHLTAEKGLEAIKRAWCPGTTEPFREQGYGQVFVGQTASV
jgi:hypothetical protein